MSLMEIGLAVTTRRTFVTQDFPLYFRPLLDTIILCMRTFPKAFNVILAARAPWPKKGDRLLRSSKKRGASAAFSAHQVARDAYIWDGYMTAGAALIDEAERRPSECDSLLYPILFNYRHGLETAMKWTVEQYGGYFGFRLDKKDHNLCDLWRLCEKILIAAQSSGERVGEPDDDIRAVERIVKEFHDVDKSALAFRYSKNKNGKMMKLPNNSIDLENMQRVMEAVNNFFKGADGMLNNQCANSRC